MGPEARLESRCCALARQAGMLAIKLHGVGLPDRLFVTPRTGACVFVEFKAPTGALRPAQKRMRLKFFRANQYVWVIRSVDVFKKAVYLP